MADVHVWLKKAACFAGCLCYAAGVVGLGYHVVRTFGSWELVHIPYDIAVAAVAGWAFHKAE